MRFLKQSHSAEKLERGDPLGFLKLQFAAKYHKTCRGDSLATKKNLRKSRTVPKKFERVAQCRKKCSKKFLAKARTRTRDRWVYL